MGKKAQKKKAAKKKTDDICSNKRCRNIAYGRIFCSTCRSRKTREADPIRYAFNNVKARATKDHIAFTLTLEIFRKFCYRTKYHLKKGRSIDGYNVDRIKEGREWENGYHEWNIQCLKKGKNIRKYYDWKKQKAVLTETLPPTKKEMIERAKQKKELSRIQRQQIREPEPDDYF
jgi:hypothetical protein